MKKIDIYNHILPQRFYDRMEKMTGEQRDMNRRVRGVPTMVDLDERFRVMDRFGDGYCQVISLSSPPLEMLVGPQHAVEMAKLANDTMAELVDKHPDRFPAFVASLPLADTDAMMKEAERALTKLDARGVQIFTNAGGKAMDAPEFMPLYDLMAKKDLPIWCHPSRGPNSPDYRTEDKSKYEMWWALGWPYETGVFMARLIFNGLFVRHPKIKIITHHMGGVVPYLEGRVGYGLDVLGKRTSDEDYVSLRKSMKKRPVDYFRMFYADTATFGASGSMRCGLEFFGADHVLFASDAPFDPKVGLYIRETIKVIDGLGLKKADKEKIYHRNAERLLKLKH